MKYGHIVKGEFLERPNRFIAYVNINGVTERVHVKNTGRCRELLTKGAAVYLEKADHPGRSTGYDLVAVQKGDSLINMDSQAPNKVVEEWLTRKALFPDLVSLRAEKQYCNSRFDFYAETETDKIFIEVKGVTLEEDGIVRFPDAPSERAVKHIEELIHAAGHGYKAYILFVVQMKGVRYFTPNTDTHPAFAAALLGARKAGVKILAYDCIIKEDSMILDEEVPVVLEQKERLTQEKKEALIPEQEERLTQEKKEALIPEQEEQLAQEKKEPVIQEFGEPDSSDRKRNDIPFGKNLDYDKILFRNEQLKGIPKLLLKWYDINRRILPWREEPTPYRVWVSEIMLQQTRVEAAKPYFERFMEALPDIGALAEAPEEVLLKLWEGLGYYNRVRNLQKAAKQILEDYEGQMPASFEELMKLKGIGSYTAGAVASIAFGQAVPAVDGNVLRVLSRIRMDDADIGSQSVKKRVEQDLQEIIPADRPGDFNQAMMELGATVCIPNGAPHCEECPLAQLCGAFRDGRTAHYPVKSGKKPRIIEKKTILIIQDENKAALHRRPDQGLLAGMYELPSMEGHRSREEVIQYLEEKGLKVIRIQPVCDAKHIFTHREWHMTGYLIRVDELFRPAGKADADGWIFAEALKTEEKYPVPSAFAAYTGYLNIKQGKEKYKRKKG